MVDLSGNLIGTKVYTKLTNTGKYIHFETNHMEYIKVGTIKTLYSRANAICSDKNSLKEEINYTINDFSKNGYKYDYVKNIIRKCNMIMTTKWTLRK